MRILHLTPELAPWSKSGGLGDAAAAIAKSVAALGHEVRVVTPLHGSVEGRLSLAVHRESLGVGLVPPTDVRVRVRGRRLPGPFRGA
jgi:glycogen synthase